MPQLQPIAARNIDRSRWIKEKVVGELDKIFPLVTDKYTVTISNIQVNDKNFSIGQQKAAILGGRTLSESIYADLVIVDNKTKKTVEKLPKFKLVDIPFLTNRSTMIVDGNDYSLTNQLRLKSGIYARRRENDIVEAFFNLAQGKNFRMIMDPQDGVFFIEIDAQKIPLYPVLLGFGVTDNQLSTTWGAELLAQNKRKSENVDVAITKLYAKFFRLKEEDKFLTTTEKVTRLSNYFSNTKMDENVNASTIGQKVGRVTVTAMINASKKILNIMQEKEETDDRDNLKYQTIHTIDDAISENIAKTAPDILRKIKYKLDNIPTGKKPSDIIPNNMFGPHVKKFLTTTAIAAPLPQINPIDIMGSAYEVTHLGPGGIKDVRMVRPETRQVNISHMGIIDPVNTKENEKAGVTLFTTPNAYKDKQGNIYTKIINVKTGKEDAVAAADLESKVIAFPNQDISKKSAMVEVLHKGLVQRMPASKVEFQFASPNQLFSTQTSLLPFMNSISGGRALMAAKHYTHSLPLKDREAPLVQVKSDSPFGTQERYAASLFLPKAKMDGVVSKVTPDSIVITGKDGTTQEDIYETNFPLNQKTFLHTDLQVKKGDKVKKNQLLGESIYTRGGDLALGKNLEVGYINYKGLNVNDGIVISESAAKKLTSMHMSKVIYETDDNHLVNKNKYTVLFPNKFNINQLGHIDQNGVAKKGSILKEGDPIILGVEQTELSAEQSMLGKLHKKLYKPYREDAIVWHHHFEGHVTDVQFSGRRIVVLVKSEQPAQVGDKLSQRSAGKGVITAIVKDEDMYQNESGQPLDVLMSPTGIISRQNPGQILETAVAKVAKKTGKPIAIDNFGIKDNHAFAKDLLKKHGLKDKEDLFDPVHNRKIKGIMTGPQYILKQSNQVDTGFSARNFGSYDSNDLPTKGGDEGSKTIGMLDINSLLTHNARNILQEVSTIKGTKNTEFWNAYMRGLPLPAPKTPFAYNKLLGLMTASGMKVNKVDNSLVASPLTDRDVTTMSSGQINSPYTVRAKDLRPEKGGLFDVTTTGGLSGTKWSHIKLNEPVINPLMKKPVQTLLGETSSGLDNRIKNFGVKSIQNDLKKIDVDKRINELNRTIPTLKHGELDKGLKELKYLKSLQANNLKPHEAYVMNNVPVLPPIMRPIVKMAGSNDLQVSSSNRLYSDIIHNNDAIKMVKTKFGDKEAGDLRMTMQQSVDALVGVGPSPNVKLQKQGLKGILTTISGGIPKEGFFQKKTVAKPQDLTGRGVAVPETKLSMDQVSLPEDMMWKMYHPMIVQRLVKKGYPSVRAIEMVKNKEEIARQELLAETKNRPVLINRAPNLHKYNIMGAYPVLSKKKTIGISPFIEKGMGADFDGDTFQVHVPVSYKAVEEAKRMTLPNMLFTDKTKQGNLIAKPELDTNYGIFKGVNAIGSGKTVTFNNYDQVKNAYKRGEVSLNDKIKIGK